ncbi:MAG: hypothetical protein WBH47_00570 [Streptosporangiaceae bacterium]
MEQVLRKAVTVVGRAHLVAELLETLVLGGRTGSMPWRSRR